jgi:hypothetical protein
MTLLALILCFFVTALAAMGAVSPSRLLGVLRKVQEPRGLLFLGVLRVVLGIALIFSAPASRAPELIGIVGIILIIRGVTLPLIGIERVRRLLGWFSAQGSAFVRGWAALATAIGLWLVYALVP